MVALTRLANRWSPKQMALAGLVCLFVGLQAFVARPVVDQWLANAIGSESRQWADLLFDGLEAAALCVAESEESTILADHADEHAAWPDTSKLPFLPVGCIRSTSSIQPVIVLPVSSLHFWPIPVVRMAPT